MKNEFMVAARSATHHLENIQHVHARIKERADARLRVAQARHAAEVARGEMAEAKAWMQLLDVPGVTIPTAAALLQVSETTVSRWVARYNRGTQATGPAIPAESND